MITYIQIELQQEGVHYYKDAPGEVAFLREPHRHMFKIKISIEVFHDDRELEFIMVKRRLENITKIFFEDSVNNHPISCEMIARNIQNLVRQMYPGPDAQRRLINVAVFEDGENGALVYDDGK